MAEPGLARHLEAMARGHALRVVNYHNTPASYEPELRSQLSRLLQRFDAVGFDELDDFYDSGSWPGQRPLFMPVFYEGYRNNATVAARVCDDLGIAAVFMICTGFLDAPVRGQEFFARSHRIGLLPEELAQDRLAMTWEDVGALSRRHVVCAHTYSHAGIPDVSTPADLEREVAEPRRRVESVTGVPAPAFAWLHGTGYGVSDLHDRAVRESGYRYLIANTMLHRIG